ncbi:hypothetical protein [Mucilaginibacter mali]|nr:hypothetical protein [Mucilaginibacter mali]
MMAKPHPANAPFNKPGVTTAYGYRKPFNLKMLITGVQGFREKD